MNAETPFQNLIRITVAAKLFRNLVGRFKTADGGYVECGLRRGSSDLVGWTPVVVTPDMVGKKLAVFTAIEAKTPGSRTEPKRLEEQTDFINAVRADGGRAGFAHTLDQARRIVDGL